MKPPIAMIFGRVAPFVSFHILALVFLAGGASQTLAASFSIAADPGTGALIGWTETALNEAGQPVAPLIDAVNAGGATGAQLRAGPFSSSPFISTLGRSFTVNQAEPILSLSFSLPYFESDPSGTGTSPFFDAFAVSLYDGSQTFSLLLLDQSGTFADPFGTAPGTVALGPSMHSYYDYALTADLSSLAGRPLSLYFDAINVDDGFTSTVTFGSVETGAAPDSKVPDPGGTLLYSVISFGGLFFLQQTMKRRRATL